MIDKHIHEDEFRLRILATDECNKSCYHCLNDFQGAPRGLYVGLTTTQIVVNDYLGVIDNPIITISGGEPSLHPKFMDLLDITGKNVIVVTNGRLLYQDCWEYASKMIGKLHIGIDSPFQFFDELETFKGEVVFQYVLHEGFDYGKVIEIVESCCQKGYVIKIFQDFYAPESFDIIYTKLVNTFRDHYLYPPYRIRFRHTGVQINRGRGCNGCMNRCITLKALWLFPDNTVSPCPQAKLLREMPTGDYMGRAYLFHKKIKK